MSDDRRAIALQALRAAGHDQAADLVAAIIPEATQAPAQAPAPAAQPEVGQAAAREQPPARVQQPQAPAQTAAAEVAVHPEIGTPMPGAEPGPTPAGPPLRSIEDAEALSDDEFAARYAEVQ